MPWLVLVLYSDRPSPRFSSLVCSYCNANKYAVGAFSGACISLPCIFAFAAAPAPQYQGVFPQTLSPTHYVSCIFLLSCTYIPFLSSFTPSWEKGKKKKDTPWSAPTQRVHLCHWHINSTRSSQHLKQSSSACRGRGIFVTPGRSDIGGPAGWRDSRLWFILGSSWRWVTLHARTLFTTVDVLPHIDTIALPVLRFFLSCYFFQPRHLACTRPPSWFHTDNIVAPARIWICRTCRRGIDLWDPLHSRQHPSRL